MSRFIIILSVLFVLLIPLSQAVAEDFYVTQDGSTSGACTTNVHSLAWLNTSGNWSNSGKPGTTGYVGAGDTVHLCGTFTGQLSVLGSGSNNSTGRITIYFENGANFYAPTYGSRSGCPSLSDSQIDATTAGISVISRSYILVDGGTNGVIENYDNGLSSLGLSYQNYTVGVLVRESSYVEVAHLTIRKMFQRVESTSVQNCSGAVQVRGSNDHININNNTLSDGNAVLGLNGTYSDVEIANNTGTKAGEGWIVAYGNANNVSIHDNTYTKGTEWGGSNPNDIHTNGVHFYAADGATYTNLKIYNNKFQGVLGKNCTTLAFFLEGEIDAPYIYNNLIIFNYPGFDELGGLINFIKGPRNVLFANNTIASTGGGIHGYILNYSNENAEGYTTGLVGYNNLAYNVAGLSVPYGGASIVSIWDYNGYSPDSIWNIPASYYTLNDWHNATGFDEHAQQGTILLDANYVPTGSDTIARDHGYNLSGYGFNTDRAGNPRTGTWDIGAYEYQGGDTTRPTVTAFSITPTIYNSRTVPIATFTATDDTAVTGYLVNESATTPTVDDANWRSTNTWTTTGYVFSTDGAKTLYAWAKDAAGNISTSLNDTVTVDTVNPTVTITTAGGANFTTRATTVTLEGISSDTNGITGNSADKGGTPSGTTSWTITGIPLVPGANSITVTGTDGAGNHGTDAITVTSIPGQGFRCPVSFMGGGTFK